jgi:transglutaminase/protease-like cytokinesis protein 3
MRKKIFCLLLFSAGFFIFSRSQTNFSKVDSIALSMSPGTFKSYDELARALTRDLKDDLSKFRAIYRWVAENIEYNISYRTAKAEKTFRKKKAVCVGYSNLLCGMCEAVGIKCEKISGFSKHSLYDINKTYKKPDHAWNAIFLSGKWQLCDVTWSAGYYDERAKKMNKRFSDTYFLMVPQNFIYTHFPEKSIWQLSDTLISKSKFKQWPFLYPAHFRFNMSQPLPEKGLIKAKLKDTLSFELKTQTKIDSINIEADGLGIVYRPVVIKKQEDTYIIRQKLNHAGEYGIIVFINGRAILGYKVQIAKDEK